MLAQAQECFWQKAVLGKFELASVRGLCVSLFPPCATLSPFSRRAEGLVTDVFWGAFVLRAQIG